MTTTAMPLIDPNRTWVPLEKRLADERDPVLRRNLEVVIAHQKAEAHGDLEALMATLCPEPVYRLGAPDNPRLHPRGTEAIRAYYGDFVASGATQLVHDIDRLAVDTHLVLTDGTIRIAYPGAVLAAMGMEVDDPAAGTYYLYESRMAIIWTIDDEGRIIGEESYTDRNGFAGIADRKLTADDIAPLRT
ncbi:nuclear transport factor 2 family protein [Yinghuangia soli]|uniref:Nuclear transport factor 2 family protein n=1 Tax=Yinghuangia soli TaxID=2908204 RepID=A0AA41U1N0_9ACTN|nr:nuclear transport factor 2 family protein [Yinghuangia soli]MCF2527732.1 nuclear transport factor 2 family protein [Yinghuangia soli]